MSGPIDVERLLRHALSPVDPPEDLATRLRNALQSISDMAAEELDGWERVAMRDPRNWVRPVAAVITGSIAGAGLVLLGRHRAGRIRAVAGRLARAARIVVRR